MIISAEAMFVQIGHLIQEAPEVLDGNLSSPDALRWHGRCHAILSSVNIKDAATFEADWAVYDQLRMDSRRNSIMTCLYRALAKLELAVPAQHQGSFIPASNAHDAMVAVGKVLREGTGDVLIVDPYMDDKALTDFVEMVAPKVSVRLLADAGAVKPSLKPAVERWKNQYGADRPLEARLAPSRALHDRLIALDGKTAWVLTQSLKDLAVRSPASITRTDADTGALKLAAYDALWKSALPL